MPEGETSPIRSMIADVQVPDWSTTQVLQNLLDLLRRRTGTVEVRLTLLSTSGVVTLLSAPTESDPARPAGVREGARLAVDVRERQHEQSVLSLILAPNGATAEQQHMLEVTRTCVAVVLRSARLNRDEREGEALLSQARHDLLAVRTRLAGAQADERRRLVNSVRHSTAQTLEKLIADSGRLVDALLDHRQRPDGPALALQEVRTGIHEALSQLRKVARGTSTAVLRSTGPAAALTALAQDLNHDVVVSGETSLRAGWEIEAALFWAVGAVLQYFDVWTSTAIGPIRVRWERIGARLNAAVEADRVRLAPDGHHQRLWTELAVETRRVEALGGELAIEVDGATTRVSVWLPVSLDHRVANG